MDVTIKQSSGLPRFSAGEDDVLIDLVSANEILWHTSDPDFKNNVEKDKKWSEIGQLLRKTGEHCKIRWKSIRDNFQRHKREEITGTGRPAKKKRAIYWTRLSFLDDMLEERQAYDNTDMIKFENEDSSHVDDEESKEHHRVTNKRKLTEIKTPCTKNVKNNDTVILKQCGEEQLNIHKSTEPENQSENEIDLFFRTMAATVKQFTPAEKVESKIKIFNIISSIEMRHHSMGTSIRNEYP